MVFSESMAQCISPHHEGKCYHAVFEKGIPDDVKTKNGKAAQQQGKHGTMNGTGYGGRNAQGVPVYFQTHKRKYNA